MGEGRDGGRDERVGEGRDGWVRGEMGGWRER